MIKGAFYFKIKWESQIRKSIGLLHNLIKWYEFRMKIYFLHRLFKFDEQKIDMKLIYFTYVIKWIIRNQNWKMKSLFLLKIN